MTNLRHSLIKGLMLAMLAVVALPACGGDEPGGGKGGGGDKKPGGENPAPATSAKPRLMWIDAGANFARFANSKENIRTDLTRLRDIGITEIVVDVRPSTGDVLFSSSHAPAVQKLPYWDNGHYQYCQRTATWDYLQAFIDTGHELGLKVNASINTFVGGVTYPYGLGQQGAVFRDADKRDWVSTRLLSDGSIVSELDLNNTTNASDERYCDAKFYNPASRQVQDYLLGIIEDLCQYDIDGLILDRCRYDDLRNDLSAETLTQFKKYLGTESVTFPDDVLVPGTKAASAAQPRLFKDFMAFRAKTISDFIGRVVARVRGVRSGIRVGTYVGAWYSEYYTMGVNWASPSYEAEKEFPLWANADYKKYGYANMLDFMLIGCYAAADRVYGTTEWTMQGFCSQARKKVGKDTRLIGGPDVGNASGFENGGQGQAVRNSVSAILSQADGYFLFDLCHVRMYDYWDALRQGIDTVKK